MSKELIDTLQALAREIRTLRNDVDRLQRIEFGSGGGGVTDHGALTGLGDNDHPQYLLTTGKAADSDKLDGNDSSYFQRNIDNVENIELGLNRATDGPAFIDFHTKNDKKDYDARIIASGGSVTAGQAKIDYRAQGGHYFVGLLHNVDSTPYLLTPSWSGWSPTLVGWSGTPSVYCYYYKLGKIMFFTAIISGTSNSTTTTFTLPETAILIEYSGTMGYCVNNGSILTAAGRYGIAQGSNICKAYTDMAAGAWTASGAKRISVYGWISTN